MDSLTQDCFGVLWKEFYSRKLNDFIKKLSSWEQSFPVYNPIYSQEVFYTWNTDN